MDDQMNLTGIPAPVPMKAISVRQPWAWLIMRPDITEAGVRRQFALSGLFKDIENREFGATYVGRLYIHAAGGMTREEFERAALFAADRGVDELPEMDEVEAGGLVGYVSLVGCVRESTSRWFTGPWGWVLREPVPSALRPCAGGAGIFDAEVALRRQREAAERAMR